MALLNVEQAKFHIKSVLVYIGIVLSSNNVGDKKCYTGSVYKTVCRTLKKDGPPHVGRTLGCANKSMELGLSKACVLKNIL